MPTKQFSVVAEIEDIDNLQQLLGTEKPSEAIRAAIIYYLQQHGVDASSGNVQHGGARERKKPE